MPEKKEPTTNEDERTLDLPSDEDTEGHTLLLDPSAHRELARRREEDVQRGVRARQREKDARRR